MMTDDAPATGSSRYALPSDLRARIGQLIVTGFEGLTARDAEPVLAQIRDGRIGGVILFDHRELHGTPMGNIYSRDQVSALTAELHAAAPEIPLLVTVDEEGGYFHRLRVEYGFPEMVSARELGIRNDPAKTRREAGVIAGALLDAGIDLNLAPVVDLHVESNLWAAFRRRAFHAEPDVVVAHATAFVEAHRERGILTTLKHFPGSGRLAVDPATGKEELVGWGPDDLAPFRRLLETARPDAVMVTRARVPAIDPVLPAMLSPRVVTDLLRGDLGFDGVVISDAMELSSIWEIYGFERSVVLALQAGVDVLLFTNIPFEHLPADRDRAKKALEAIVAAVERGDLSERRIDEACSRVLALKSRMGAARRAS